MVIDMIVSFGLQAYTGQELIFLQIDLLSGDNKVGQGQDPLARQALQGQVTVVDQ